MARTVEKLSALRVAREAKPGLYGDGGLYLRVSESGGKSWVYRYMLDRRSHEMGLGATHAVSLAEARQKAADARSLCARGVDPLKQKNAAEAERRLKEALEITFKDCAERYFAAHEKSWSNKKHRTQWKATLATDTPELRIIPIATKFPNNFTQKIYTAGERPTMSAFAVAIEGKADMRFCIAHVCF
ncbi:MAG TPA: Arm DNA-binding domain-containing protein [Pseudolabrys sp.]|nr:Arm DNA-binding domain-containing protein [Pseudolabrys sp.]